MKILIYVGFVKKVSMKLITIKLEIIFILLENTVHRTCNLQYKKPKFVFNNLSGYDAHLFIKNLGVSEGNIDCIPNNEEKYISLSKENIIDIYTNKYREEKYVKREMRFINSFKFMASSLDKLISNLDSNCF